MELIIPEIDNHRQSNKTYKIDWINGRINGFIDQKEAVEQAITKIMLTQRYNHLIYSSDYGNENNTLIPQNSELSENYIITNVEKYTIEALLTDERILKIKDFEAVIEKDEIQISFLAETIFGLVKYEGGA